MKRLTKFEEKQILLKAYNEGNFLGNGSSRAVYSLGDGYCVKVAIDRKGQFQNHIEVDTYATYGRKNLAEVKAFGKYIVVMEEVQPVSHIIEDAIWLYERRSGSTYYSSYDSDYTNSNTGSDSEYESHTEEEKDLTFEGLTAEEVKEAMMLIEWLDDVMGHTSDNQQIGFARDGRAVAYDYGYMPENHDISVSDTLGDAICEYGEVDFLQVVASKLY